MENIDTSSPAGKVMFAIISAMAEFERDLIRERVKAGIGRAKKKGVRLGRPSLMNDELKETIGKLREGRNSIRAIAKEGKVSPSLVPKTLSDSETKEAIKPGIRES